MQHRKAEVPPQPLHQRAFLRLLADRCRWLQRYAKWLAASYKDALDISGSPSIGDLFEQFLIEAATLCNKDFQHNLTANPPLLSSRDEPPLLSFVDFHPELQRTVRISI